MPRMQRQSASVLAHNMRVNRRTQSVTDNLETFGKIFDSSMKKIGCIPCSRCRALIDNDRSRRGMCYTCYDKNNTFNVFGPENGMDIGDIPIELKDMTLVEQCLIALVHPVISVFKIRGMQTGYSGNVINFNQNITGLHASITQVLPHRINSLSAILILGRHTPDGLLQFRVRASKVLNGLRWLKRNNFYYRNIIIDPEAINCLPSDGDVLSQLPQALQDGNDNEVIDNGRDPTNLIQVSGYPNVLATDADEAISRALEQEVECDGPSWPSQSADPQKERQEGLICKAFPCLFPYGKGDLNFPREKQISPNNYFKFLLAYSDRRFARDLRFPYFAHNSLARWNAMSCGRIYVNRNRLGDRVIADLQMIHEDPDENVASAIMYYGATLRGTRSFWKQRCSELLQMVRQLGAPTIFITLSAADYHWPDLFKLLLPNNFDLTTLTEAQRAKLMHDNPDIVAWFFDRRVDCFFKHFLKPFFKVQDYWFRFEWQHRGSPHIHGFLWLPDAIDCSNLDSLSESQRKAYAIRFDNYVSAQIDRIESVRPWENPCRKRFSDIDSSERQNDLNSLLNAIQRHTRCGDHCLRQKRGSRRKECRYGFPIPTQAESELKKEGGSWKFLPKRNDVYLQRYNKFITMVWRGNTDFSVVLELNSVINYIAKYASKAENSSLSYSDVLGEILSRRNQHPDHSILGPIQQLLISSVAERNFSAQEVMHLLKGWPLYHSSREFVVLNTKNEWEKLESLDEANHNKSLLELYKARNNELIEVTLLEFFKSYKVSRGTAILRTKEVVVRVLPYIKPTDSPAAKEDYYRQQCMLNIAWRGDFEEMKPSNVTWEEWFIESEAEQANNDELPDPEEVEYIDVEPEIQIVRDAGMAASRMNTNRIIQEPLGARVIDEAMEWPNLSSANISEQSITNFIRDYNSQPVAQVDRQATISYQNMSRDQKNVIAIARNLLNNRDVDNNIILVQGKAGTGKSAIINELCRGLDRYCRDNGIEGPIYKVLAPTGVAASNVDGATYHSVLKIPIQTNKFTGLNGETLRALQLSFRNVKFVIIDEYSMIGLRNWGLIHTRLYEATTVQKPFGGLNMFIFGDLRQLPPVGDTAIYGVPRNDWAKIGKQVMNSITTTIFLTHSYRQSGDQQSFRSALDEIAIGQPSRESWQFLITRRAEAVNNWPQIFSKSVYLFPNNRLVGLHNLECLSKNGLPVVRIPALHNNSTAATASSQLAGGLERELILSLDCRVMLRKNLCVSRKLVNGEMGYVRDILYYPGQAPPSLPCAIMVEFDNYIGPFYQPPTISARNAYADRSNLRQRCFPIVPVTNKWNHNSTECSRRQFPFVLAYALTIHKSQGLTLDKAVVDIGEQEQTVGLTYVGLSRVRTVEGLLLLNGFGFERLSRIGDRAALKTREDFLRELQRS